MTKKKSKKITKAKQMELNIEALEKEILESKPFKEWQRCLKLTTQFVKPIEEKYTGVGLPVLFGFLVMKTGCGIIETGIMGGGKTLKAIFQEELMKITKTADWVFPISEFKKTDWRAMFTKRIYTNETLHFSVREASILQDYSLQFIIERLSELISDGHLQYRWGNEPEEEIIMTNCKASIYFASQPPRTHHIINNTTFRTLANDRYYNMICLNQLRGRKNTHLREVPSVVLKIPFTKEVSRKGVKTTVKTFFNVEPEFIKFGSNKADHITKSDLKLDDLIDLIRNQFSVDRRETHMNNLISEWGSFLNIKVIKQIHVDLFIDLFGFYLTMFNKLTIGTVEQSVNFRFGAAEMVSRISSLRTRNYTVTQKLLCKEFNAEEQDVEFHLSELLSLLIVQKSKTDKVKKRKRVNKSKSPLTVRKQTKILQNAGIIARRFASHRDIEKDPSIKAREAIYEFTPEITDYFRLYADILYSFMGVNELKKIVQIKEFLEESEVK